MINSDLILSYTKYLTKNLTTMDFVLNYVMGGSSESAAAAASPSSVSTRSTGRSTERRMVSANRQRQREQERETRAERLRKLREKEFDRLAELEMPRWVKDESLLHIFLRAINLQENGGNERKANPNVPHYPDSNGLPRRGMTASGHYGFTEATWEDYRPNNVATQYAYQSDRETQYKAAIKLAEKLWDKHRNWFDAGRGWKGGLPGSSNMDLEIEYGLQVVNKMKKILKDAETSHILP